MPIRPTPRRMRHPVSTSSALRVLRDVAFGFKDASRRRSRRSPLAILDPGHAASLDAVTAGTRELALQPNQGTVPGSCEACGAAVEAGVIRLSDGPSAPEDADPGTREGADGMRVLSSTLTGFLVEGGGPCAGMAGVVCEACD